MVDGFDEFKGIQMQKPTISVYSSKWFSLTAIQLCYAQIVFINEQNILFHIVRSVGGNIIQVTQVTVRNKITFSSNW